MNDPTALYITAVPRLFSERKVIKSLDQIAALCSVARLGNPMNGTHYASVTPDKKWMLKIFFANTEDLLDFERLITHTGYLANVAKYCKGKDQGVETIKR